MRYKTDWSQAQQRLTALWHGQRMDRPCIAVRAPIPDAPSSEPIAPADVEGCWLDPGFRVQLARRTLQSTWWGGESIPSCLQMAGWMICLGGTPRFDRHTIWFDAQAVDFTQPSPFRHQPDSPWMRKFVRLWKALCDEAGCDGFLVGSPLMLPACDLLSMHMGTEAFLLAMMDQPQWLADAILHGAREQVKAWRQIISLTRESGHVYWNGNAGWMALWTPEPYFTTQCDVSCMMSPELFNRFIMPELEIYGGEYGATWHHLDGGDARKHLPSLLSLSFLKVIQYTPMPCEPPNGPAHLEMYKQIQSAGKIVHIQVTLDHIEPLVRQLDPARLILDTTCASHEQGERLLEQCVDWCAESPCLCS
ncbi:MAG: hypothetical protein IT440_14090 [Phycisphaeraceae bacterium]|nr:hypothetical protein [Phycisphaeraceae bacterium]